MALKGMLLPLLNLFVFVAFLLNSCNADERKVHIVYMGERPPLSTHHLSVHHSMLKSVIGSSVTAKNSLVYSYGSFNGFAARLTDDEVQTFSEMEGVVSVFPNHILKLHTTRSWDFLGDSTDVVGGPLEGDVIVGMLDTGIWPEHESFNDQNLGSPPSKWKGTCQGANFTCNNKIIGARYYNSEDLSDIFQSPRDSEGHGSHTASTVAGIAVDGANYFGLANGTARGGVEGARLAVYKVCWSFGCSSADILAAFDDAIADGVDIISVSLGSDINLPYTDDPIAIGSFHAMKNGILTSCSAGNSGPYPYTVANYAPWILTVGASTIDRKFVATAVLGNGIALNGLSVNNFDLNGTSYPLIWGGDAPNVSAGVDSSTSRYCFPGSLNMFQVWGRIVYCELLWDGSVILQANGVGTIMADDEYLDGAFSYPLPATVISRKDGQTVLDYIKTEEYPIATILVADGFKDPIAPTVVSFSSRGPNPVTLDILKPDLTAPGVDILAAWSPVAPPSIYEADTRSTMWNIISGTSMSCPHASGAAAYIKAQYPNWSPAAIKSALMTTATVMDLRRQEDLEFAYGSGQINPAQALYPGLVYDADEIDYINFLCKQGYNTTTVRLLTGDNSTICPSTEHGRAWDLNYPSFSLAVEDGQKISAVFNRTVTNVGSPNSNYTLFFHSPADYITITVEPTYLSFSSLGEVKSFTLTIDGPNVFQLPIISGSIVWDDGTYQVRSPVVVYTVLPGSTSSDNTYQSKPLKINTFQTKPLKINTFQDLIH